MQSISEKLSILDENLQRQFLEVRRARKPIICQKLKFIYFYVPKCACTSLKCWIYKIEFDKEFKTYKKDNRSIHIHNCGEFNTIALQKILEKKQDYTIITVIRDPIKRLISAYANRVIHHKELSEHVAYRDDIEAAGLKFNPDINYFIENLESYQNCAKTILHHTRPITHFIGQDLSLYTNIYPIEEINRIKEDVLVDSNPSLNTDSLPEIAKLQSGGPKLKLSLLKPESFEKLVAYYAKDYEILGNYYSLEKIKEEYISSIVDRGNELKEQGMLSESIENYQNAIALQPEQPTSVYTELGNALEQNGQIEEAIATYQKAIEIVPENFRIYAKLANLMMRQGNIEGAVIAYQKAITQAQKPKQPAWFYNWVYSELGEALEKNGQIEEAIAAYQKSIEFKSDNPGVYLTLAQLYFKKNQWDCVIDSYQKAIKLKPEQPVQVYLELGDAFNQNDQIYEAISAYQKAIEINPNNSMVHAKLAGTIQKAIPLEYKGQQKTDIIAQYWPQTLSQMGQDYWVINEAFAHKRNGYFLEIGSADGITINNTYLLEKRYGWSGICVEPNPDSFEKLKFNRDCICVKVCVDEKKGEVDFVFDNLMGGILDEDTDNYRRIKKKENLANKITRIQTIPLVELLKQYKAPKTIDYFSLDVEGAETRILKNFPFKEYTFLCLTIERPSQVLENILRNNGYILVKLIPGLDSFFIHESFQKEYKKNLKGFYRERNQIMRDLFKSLPRYV